MVIIGKRFPSLDLKAVDHNGKVFKLNVGRLAIESGKRILLFFYPKDFTSLCPTELFAFQERIKEFEKRNCVIIGVSCDTVETHLAWLNTPSCDGGIRGITFQLLSDTKRAVSSMLGILDDEDNVTYRATYMIDENGVVFHESVNNMVIGRNVEDYMRLLDAKDYFEKTGNFCPANWKDGEDGMVATKEGVSEYFTSHQLKDI
jgi:peroxiredoxin (alkyl hydroperoxide reductase subunit C)